MSTAELNRKKLELIAWINKLSDEHIIEFLDELKMSIKKEPDWWDNLSENQKKVIEKGAQEIDEGDTISSSDFWNKLKNG